MLELLLLLLLRLLHRNLQRAICGCEQQWGVITLRLRRVDIVVERVSLLRRRLVEQVMLLLLLLMRGRRRRRSVVVVEVEVVKALVRVLAWIGRIGDDGLHHVGRWVLGGRASTRSLTSSRRAIRLRSKPTDGSISTNGWRR